MERQKRGIIAEEEEGTREGEEFERVELFSLLVNLDKFLLYQCLKTLQNTTSEKQVIYDFAI